MFQKETLFILGAGASKPYGFPLGDELIENIIEHINTDSIYFPINEKNKNDVLQNRPLSLNEYNIFQNNNNKILKKIQLCIRDNDLKNLFTDSGSRLGEMNDNIFDNKIYELEGIRLVRIKLKRIKELNDLSIMLQEFDPVSIDAFLRDHPEHRIAGQTMIIYSLINCHRTEKFKKKMKKDKTIEEKKREDDNWYRFLINDIKAGCQNSSDLLNNKISISTYNYDLSLDYYLRNRLLNTSFFNDHAAEFLDSLKINHIYGSIFDADKAMDFFDLRPKYFKEENYAVNFHHLLYGYVSSIQEEPRIKMIGERENCKATIEKIKSADVINFIGFGFDEDNLATIGFSKDIGTCKALFPTTPDTGGNPKIKKIFYLDYKGELNTLADEFQKLTEFINYGQSRPWLKIIRSKTTSISRAYVNDFKQRLFF